MAMRPTATIIKKRLVDIISLHRRPLGGPGLEGE